jgi:hypothetical protein
MSEKLPMSFDIGVDIPDVVGYFQLWQGPLSERGQSLAEGAINVRGLTDTIEIADVRESANVRARHTERADQAAELAERRQRTGRLIGKVALATEGVE